MDQVQNAGAADQAQFSESIRQAADFVVQGVGQLHPALAVAGLIGAIERIACAGDQHFAMGVAQMLDDCAGGLRSAVIAAGAPQIEVAK